MCSVLERVVLGEDQAQFAAGGDAVTDQRRVGRSGGGAGAGPGRFDGSFDQAWRDGAGHPPADGEPGVGGDQLEAEVRLAAEGASPRRAEQRDQVGPQRDRALRIDVGRGEHGDQAGALSQAAALTSAHDGDGDAGGEGDGDEGGASGDTEVAGQVGEVSGAGGRSRRRDGRGSGREVPTAGPGWVGVRAGSRRGGLLLGR